MVNYTELQILPKPRVIKQSLKGIATIYNHQTNKRYSITLTRRYVLGDGRSYANAEEQILNSVHKRVKNEHTYIGFLQIGKKCFKDILKIKTERS